MTRLVILDCDNALGLPGRDVDDALALLFLLRQPDVQLRAVTTCFGNAPLDGVLRVTRRLLPLLERPLLPLRYELLLRTPAPSSTIDTRAPLSSLN